MAQRAAARSRSAPPDPAVLAVRRNPAEDNEGEDEDNQPSTFPPLPVEPAVGVDTPAWLRDLSMSRVGRHSRASSIISTRTRFSTTTLDEVRSIEISAGGQTFRISRDGSRVTDTTAPPPYSGSFWGSEVGADDDDDEHEAQGDTEVLLQEAHEIPQPDAPQPDAPQPDAENENYPRGRRKRVRIVMPDDDVDESEDGSTAEPANTSQGPESSRRVLTKADLYHLMLDLPFQLKRVLGLGPFNHAQTVSREHQDQDLELLKRPRPTSSQSLPDSFMLHEENPLDFGHGKQVVRKLGSLTDDDLDAMRADDTSRSLPNEQELSIPLTVTDLNELSLVYSRAMKDLDRENRKKLHERDKELAQLRSLLNEKDIVYRQQLRGKDFIIEDLKRRLEHNEDTMEAKLEKARNEVEDQWERRWKDRDRHLMERMRRIEDAAHKQDSTPVDAE